MPVSTSRDLKPSARSSTFKLSQVERAVTKVFSLASGSAASGMRAGRSATYRAGLLEVSGGRGPTSQAEYLCYRSFNLGQLEGRGARRRFQIPARRNWNSARWISTDPDSSGHGDVS